MERYVGKAVSEGTAIGKLFYSKEEQEAQQKSITDTDAELERFEKAKEIALEQLHMLYEKALKEVGEENAAIFQVHSMILEDDSFHTSVKNIIVSRKVHAEYAVAAAGDKFACMFAETNDEYFQARSADIKDIARRVISILHGSRKAEVLGEEPVILAAKDLTPSETVQMDRSKLLGLVTELGSSNSHTAILARAMNIPALIGIPINAQMNGKTAILDGAKGELLIDPDPETLWQYEAKQKGEVNQKALFQTLKGKKTVTLDGKHIKLFANISSVDDLDKVLANDADGIGLFRSEFLYLKRSSYPTEEEQFQAYKAAAEAMAGKKVIIRTLDIGADKRADYFQIDQEENPAMGYRAIRICLDRQEIFKTQLRALLRASAYGNLGIMYPMIISVEEVRCIKKIVEELKKEFDDAGIPYGDFEQGIMIETPAAVMISDLLAKEVDFFSIGTNDLTQFTLAIDRQNAKLAHLYDAHHTAILRMIQMTVENGHKENCWVGICGEAGADTTLTTTFLKMGIDELSVAPASVLPIRKRIREITITE